MAAWHENRNSNKTVLRDWLPIVILAVVCFIVVFFDIHV